jgi:hypothetical protein
MVRLDRKQVLLLKVERLRFHIYRLPIELVLWNHLSLCVVWSVSLCIIVVFSYFCGVIVCINRPMDWVNWNWDPFWFINRFMGQHKSFPWVIAGSIILLLYIFTFELTVAVLCVSPSRSLICIRNLNFIILPPLPTTFDVQIDHLEDVSHEI